MGNWICWDEGDLLLDPKLQTRASRSVFAEPWDDRQWVRMTGSTVDGQTNAYLATWPADQFGAALGGRDRSGPEKPPEEDPGPQAKAAVR